MKTKSILNPAALASLALLSLSPVVSAQNFSNAAYSSPQNPFDQWGASHYECTRYAWGRAKEVTGKSLTFTQTSGRHGGRWHALLDPSLERGQTPRAHSIISWSYGSYGHVAFVESVNGDSITISEANWSNPPNGRYNGTRTLTRSQWQQRGSYRANGFVYLADVNPPTATRPSAPTGLSGTFRHDRIDLRWMRVAGANAYRIQIAPFGTRWTAGRGFTSSSRASSSVPVNYSSSSYSYRWQNNSSGSAGAPVPGQLYSVTVRVNVPGRGSSNYSNPRWFRVPAAPAAPSPSITLSTSSINRSVSQGSNPSSSSFTIRNSGGGRLSYRLSDNASWMRLSRSSGTSTGENDTIRVYFTTSSLAPGTYRGTVTTSASGVASKTISVRLTVAATGGSSGGSGSSSSDDHGNTTRDATYMYSRRSGQLERSGDVDMFRIVLRSGQTALTVQTTGSTDTMGELLDSRGRRITSNDDSGSGYNFRIRRTGLRPGTYYVKVRGYGSRTGSYRLYVSR